MSAGIGARSRPRSGVNHRLTLARTVPVALLAILAGILLGNLLAFIQVAPTIILYPYHADYGEGIVWQQMLNMLDGTAYGAVGVFPAIVYHYPPVYHLTVGLLSASFGSDPLATGRALSLAATAISAALVCRLVVEADATATSARARWIAGAIAAALFFTGSPMIEWALRMRVDLFACMLGLAGLTLAIRSIERPRSALWAAASFVLAVYTKQTSIAAPAAAFIGLLVVRPRAAWRLAGAGFAIAIVPLVALEFATGGGFLRHIILYNINRNDPSQLALLIAPIAAQPFALLVGGGGAAFAARYLLERWPSRFEAPRRYGALLIVLLFALLRTALLATIMKSGSSTNYMLEWMAAMAICLGIATAPAVAALTEGARRTRSVGGAALLALLAVQAAMLPRWADVRPVIHQRVTELGRVVAMIRSEPRPVISDDMTLLIRAGKPVEWEPSIAAELASTGRYDEPAFVKLVEDERIGFFVTEGDRGERVFDSRYDPAVATAMKAHYPVEHRIGGLILHLPRSAGQ